MTSNAQEAATQPRSCARAGAASRNRNRCSNAPLVESIYQAAAQKFRAENVIRVCQRTTFQMRQHRRQHSHIQHRLTVVTFVPRV